MKQILPVAERIKSRRRTIGITQLELGVAIGLTPEGAKVQVSRWETGASQPEAETVRAIAKALDTTTDYLLGATDDPRPPGRSIAEVAISIVADVVDTVRDPIATDEPDPRAERVAAKFAELRRVTQPEEPTQNAELGSERRE